MVTRDAWRTEAPKLIRAELEKRLPSETKIVSVEPDSFYHEGEEHRYVIVRYKGASPYADHEKLGAIKHDIHMMLWELDYDPTPVMYFQAEGTNRI